MAELSSTITCPKCSATSVEQMPMNACQWFYECRGCGAVLKPLKGDCCVFCSYGTVPCPPVQDGQCCCS
ncbi:MAG: GDCCVxC domain-containing (seleno)protein [Paracoccaceae bacterium]